MDVTQDIDSLTNFKRQTAIFLRRMKKRGEPLVLTVNGKAEIVVQDAASYQRLIEALERAETVAGIRRGIADAEAGRKRSIEKMAQEKRRKYGLSG
jgi:prevent-host-death family protein